MGPEFQHHYISSGAGVGVYLRVGQKASIDCHTPQIVVSVHAALISGVKMSFFASRGQSDS